MMWGSGVCRSWRIWVAVVRAAAARTAGEMHCNGTSSHQTVSQQFSAAHSSPACCAMLCCALTTPLGLTVTRSCRRHKTGAQHCAWHRQSCWTHLIHLFRGRHTTPAAALLALTTVSHKPRPAWRRCAAVVSPSCEATLAANCATQHTRSSSCDPELLPATNSAGLNACDPVALPPWPRKVSRAPPTP